MLKILAGLETADEGYIEGLENKKISIVFQEDRLCPALNAFDNIRLSKALAVGIFSQQYRFYNAAIFGLVRGRLYFLHMGAIGSV